MLKRIIGGLLLALVMSAAGIGGTAFAQGTVPQQFINSQTATSYTFVPRDCSKMVTFSNSSTVAVTLPQAGTGGFLQGCFIDVMNRNTGTITITPTTSTIDGLVSFALPKNASRRITTDGTNYFTQAGSTALGIPTTGSTVNLSLGAVAPSVATTPQRWMPIVLTDGGTYWFPVWK